MSQYCYLMIFNTGALVPGSPRFPFWRKHSAFIIRSALNDPLSDVFRVSYCTSGFIWTQDSRQGFHPRINLSFRNVAAMPRLMMRCGALAGPSALCQMAMQDEAIATLTGRPGSIPQLPAGNRFDKGCLLAMPCRAQLKQRRNERSARAFGTVPVTQTNKREEMDLQ